MPLALELAASWVKVLSCAEIAEELEQSFSILHARPKDMLPRHSSMELVFEHSWKLLSSEECYVLQAFSVFRGGCTRDAAQQITNATLPILTSLIEKSLLRHGSQTGRYDLHELVRQYAEKQLRQNPNEHTIIQEQHCTYYTDLLHQKEATAHLGDQQAILNDFDNIRVAWRYAVQTTNLQALRRAMSSLYWVYHFHGWRNEGETMFRLAQEALQTKTHTIERRYLLGSIQLISDYLATHLGRLTADDTQNCIESTFKLWDGLEQRPDQLLSLTRALLMLLDTNNPPTEIIAFAEQVIRWSRQFDDQFSEVIAISAQARVLFEILGKFHEAQQLAKQALAIAQNLGFDLNARWNEKNIRENSIPTRSVSRDQEALGKIRYLSPPRYYSV